MPTFTGHIDGIAVWIDGRIEAVFPSVLQAMSAMKTLREAKADFDRVISETISTNRRAA